MQLYTNKALKKALNELHDSSGDYYRACIDVKNFKKQVEVQPKPKPIFESSVDFVADVALGPLAFCVFFVIVVFPISFIAWFVIDAKSDIGFLTLISKIVLTTIGLTLIPYSILFVKCLISFWMTRHQEKEWYEEELQEWEEYMRAEKLRIEQQNSEENKKIYQQKLQVLDNTYKTFIKKCDKYDIPQEYRNDKLISDVYYDYDTYNEYYCYRDERDDSGSVKDWIIGYTKYMEEKSEMEFRKLMRKQAEEDRWLEEQERRRWAKEEQEEKERERIEKNQRWYGQDEEPYPLQQFGNLSFLYADNDRLTCRDKDNNIVEIYRDSSSGLFIREDNGKPV